MHEMITIPAGSRRVSNTHGMGSSLGIHAFLEKETQSHINGFQAMWI
jgi:hypothetical protein